MAINFDTHDPRALLAAFKKAIDDRHVITWSYDNDGDFTHTPDQWKSKAWLRPVIYQGRLTLNFIGSMNEKTSKALYGVFHGRFIESMLAHCDQLFSNATATAIATNADIITTSA